jgi:hypothetical protein
MKFILLSIIAFLLLSCEKERLQDFTNTRQISSIPISKIDLLVGGNVTLNVIDTLLIVANQVEPFIRIYSTNSHELISTFGKEGRGPKEFLSASVTKQDYFQFSSTITKKAINLYDFKRNKLTIIDLQKYIESGEGILRLRVPSDREFISSHHYLDTEISIATPLDRDLFIIHNFSDTTFKRVDFKPELNYEVKRNDKPSVYRPAVFVNKKDKIIASAPLKLGELDFFNFDGELINETIFESREKFKSEIESGLGGEENIKTYIVELDTLKNEIFALNINTPVGELDSKIQNNLIQKFNWDGDPLLQYELDGKSIKSFAVDHINNRIYAYIHTERKNNIIIYNLDQ